MNREQEGHKSYNGFDWIFIRPVRRLALPACTESATAGYKLIEGEELLTPKSRVSKRVSGDVVLCVIRGVLATL